jgi:hypothetical protein
MSRAVLASTLRSLAVIMVCTMAVLSLTIAPTASADEGADMPGQDSGNCGFDGEGGWICEGQEGSSPGGPSPDDTVPVGSDGKPVCKDGVREVPCTNKDGGAWNGRCYATVLDPPPAKADPVWEGQDEGVIMTCVLRSGDCDQSAGVHLPIADCTQRWWTATPEGSVDVEQVARDAFARANPTEIPIGIVPENIPGSVGLVGMPVWMWVQNPGTQTVGPLTATAPAGSATVTSTGRVVSIDWDMGDGTVVTCRGTGTAYQDSFGVKDSPDCGHRYEKQGAPYTVTATSHWVVEWHGAGQSSTFTLDIPSETQIVVGEAQVITQ